MCMQPAKDQDRRDDVKTDEAYADPVFLTDTMAELGSSEFRAIIVGAGPVGLYLAHALSRANINYVLLEQYHSVFRYRGASLLLFPQMLRQLDQIGLYGKAEKDFIICHSQTELLASNGRVIKSTPELSTLKEQCVTLAYPPWRRNRPVSNLSPYNQACVSFVGPLPRTLD